MAFNDDNVDPTNDDSLALYFQGSFGMSATNATTTSIDNSATEESEDTNETNNQSMSSFYSKTVSTEADLDGTLTYDTLSRPFQAVLVIEQESGTSVTASPSAIELVGKTWPANRKVNAVHVAG